MYWSFGVYNIGRHYSDHTSDIKSKWFIEFDQVSEEFIQTLQFRIEIVLMKNESDWRTVTVIATH